LTMSVMMFEPVREALSVVNLNWGTSLVS